MATYIVKKNDTLSGIAKTYSTTVNELLRLNPDITNKDLIYVGQEITISGTPKTKTTNYSQTAKITNFGIQSGTEKQSLLLGHGIRKTQKSTKSNGFMLLAMGSGLSVKTKQLPLSKVYSRPPRTPLVLCFR